MNSFEKPIVITQENINIKHIFTDEIYNCIEWIRQSTIDPKMFDAPFTIDGIIFENNLFNRINVNKGNFIIANETALKDAILRDQFLIKIFTLAKFNSIQETCSIRSLVAFHSTNKYLFMTFHPGQLTKIGRIVANHEKKSDSEVYAEYAKGLIELLNNPFSIGAQVNTFSHIFGYFSKQLTTSDKEAFQAQLDLYKQNQISKTPILHTLYNWAIQFEQAYLLNQRIFKPYPDSFSEL